jgi:hypothetical protein
VSWSWAALIPLAVASVAARSMVENRRPPAQVVLALEGLGDPVLEDPGGGEVGAGTEQDQDHDGDQQLAHEAAQVVTSR